MESMLSCECVMGKLGSGTSFDQKASLKKQSELSQTFELGI